MKKKCVLLMVVVSVFLVNSVKAQMTLYYMDRLPQIQQYNPALIPKVTSFTALPMIGGQQFEVNNSGFNLGQFLDFSDHIGESNYNPDEFIRSIGDQNKTTFEMRSNLFAMGFRLKKNQYLSMGISLRNFTDITAPSKIVYLTESYEDIANKMPLTIDGINIRMNAFTETSLTYARTIGDKLTVGISPKLIGALGGISSEKLNFQVSQSDEELGEFDQQYDGTVHVGLPVAINPDAIGANGELNQDEDILDPDWSKNISASMLFENVSLAVDLGVNYQLNQNWSFSASVVDIGKSSWKKYGYDISYNGETAIVKDLDKFKMKIPTKIYVGADYKLSQNWNAGLLFRDVMYESGSYQSATLSLNGYIGSMLSTSVSYTSGHTSDNVGFGLRLRFFPGTDLFVVTDNILQVFDYKKMQYSSVAFGINFSLGVRNKVLKDEPDENL